MKDGVVSDVSTSSGEEVIPRSENIDNNKNPSTSNSDTSFSDVPLDVSFPRDQNTQPPPISPRYDAHRHSRKTETTQLLDNEIAKNSSCCPCWW